MHFLNFNYYCFIDKFNPILIKKLPKNTSLIYRNYKDKINTEEILLLKNYCRKKKIKLYLSNNIKLSIKLNLDGAYIPSFNTSITHNNFSFKKKFFLIGSAHNLKEILIKEKQKISNIFISPLFLTKKNKYYLGIYKFLILKNLNKRNTTCLGGINKNNIKKIKMLNLNNIAGINFFKQI